MTKLILKNANLWTSTGCLVNQSILLEKGKIVQISEEPIIKDSPHEVLDLSQKILIPLGVDAQVHMRVPGQSHKETPLTALHACIVGGIGAVLTMPNTKPVIDSTEVIQQCKHEIESAQNTYPVHVEISAAITKGQRGKEAVDFKSLIKAGAIAFTDDGVGVVSDDIMRAAFAASAEWGVPILQHAEYPGHGAVLAQGPVQEKLCLYPYSDEAEYKMVERDLRLLQDYPDARYHVLHVSCQKTVELVEAAKNKNLKATCEVSPHHLYLNSSDIQLENSSYKMNPPLRESKHQHALQKALADGIIDFVATDHAPHEPESKTANFKTAAFGTTGLETSLRVLLSLVQNNILTPQRLVEVFSTKPAEFLGIGDQFGHFKIGQYLNAAVFDPKTQTKEITIHDLASLSKNNCFLGHKLPGKIEKVFLKDRDWTL